MDKLWIFFSSSQKFKATSQYAYWSSGIETYTEHDKILKKAPERDSYAKGYEKCKTLSEILKQRFQTCMTTHGQKF